MNLKLSILLILAITLFSCKENHEEYHNIIDKIEANSMAYKKDSTFSNNQFEISELTTVIDNDPHFYIKNRKSEIESYACSECHNKPVSQLQSEDLGKKAHWDIKLIHADDKTMSCLSCHKDNDMDNLHSITGGKIDFNLSYQLCAQCHNKEVKDWKGGAHGKNISGWQTSRVSKLCVECHNPHNPSFEKRWPARYNTQMVEQRK
ncbi:MAG: cytochrome C [Flavobacteriaceae bacterium]|nr:cytochrome C [Flavobacteriaceae bacterium]